MAFFAVVMTLLVDLVLLALDYQEFGIKGIAGGYHLVDYWDIVKALAIGAALLVLAQRGRSRAIRVLALVFILLAIEDLITLHGFVASVLRTLSGGLISMPLGELISFIGFGFLVLALVWTGSPPSGKTLLRARAILTGLLFALFLFTGVVDFFTNDSIPGVSPLAVVEESGERLVLTLTVGYVAGLSAMSGIADHRRKSVQSGS